MTSSEKSTALIIQTRSDTLTVEEGALSPLRNSPNGNSVDASERSAPKGLSSNEAVARNLRWPPQSQLQ
jgi:hypothetical protein